MAAVGAEGQNVTLRLVLYEVIRGREVPVVEYELHYARGRLVADEGHGRVPLERPQGCSRK